MKDSAMTRKSLEVGANFGDGALYSTRHAR
jgi:hypothetical protein